MIFNKTLDDQISIFFSKFKFLKMYTPEQIEEKSIHPNQTREFNILGFVKVAPEELEHHHHRHRRRPRHK